MANEENKFTHVAVRPKTKRKVAMLAKALDVDIYSLVDDWAETEWKSAKKAGLVTDKMLEHATVQAPK